MSTQRWTDFLKSLPPGLTVAQVSRLFGRSYTLTRRRLVEAGYSYAKWKLEAPGWVRAANWKLTNAEISRRSGMSRERVRQWREKLRKPKVGGVGRPSKNHDHKQSKLAVSAGK